MKLNRLLSIGLAAASLTCATQAQQFFGPWVHGVNDQLSVFIDAVNGNDGNSGLDPANAVQTLPVAAGIADGLLSVSQVSGVTINMLPGTYNLTAPLPLPAFGLAIEPYFDSTAGSVVVTGSFPGSGLFEFDHLVGPITEATTGGLPDSLPPSVVRGITFTGISGEIGVRIDPSVSGGQTGRPIEVQVNQCTITACSIGVQIRNTGAMQTEYQNQLIDNDFVGCTTGLQVINAWWHSDLIRSNRFTNSFTAMSFNGSNAADGRLHPRILSNTVNNSSFLVGVILENCSARIVNNTFAFATSPCCTTNTATIWISSDANGSAGESIAIVNNLLFSPTYTAGPVTTNPPEIRIAGSPYLGALLVDSNDFDNSVTGTTVGVLFAPAMPPQTTGSLNIGISNPQFAAGPGSLHLTAGSPSVSQLGNQAFVLPGPTATITLNGQSLPAHHALDMDLDARTQMRPSDLTDVLHRGSDQFLPSGQRLRTATAGPNPLQLADRFGNLPVDGSGNATVDLLLDLPVGSVFALMWGAALPMGPELQHLVLSPFGSFAVDPTSPNGVLLPAIVTTANPQPFTLPLGTFAPNFTEAEQFLQALVLLPSGVTTFTNRLRIDVDAI